MQYAKVAGLLAALGVAVGGGVWLSGKQLGQPTAPSTTLAAPAVMTTGANTPETSEAMTPPLPGTRPGEGNDGAARDTGAPRPQVETADGKEDAVGGVARKALAMRGDIARNGIARDDGARDGPAREPRQPAHGTVDVMTYLLGTTLATMGGTVARVLDTFIVVLSGELDETRRLAAGAGGNDLAAVVEQMRARDELNRPGLKGPIRRFMDKYCILGYLTGRGTCDR